MIKIKTLNDIPSIAKYLNRIGAEPRSLASAVIKRNHGTYWKDLAVIRFNSSGQVIAPKQWMPTQEEQVIMIKEAEEYLWPRTKKLAKVYELPDELKGLDKEKIFEFRDQEGMLCMLQVRKEIVDKGDKLYIPWSFYDDGEWRAQEPEGKLPLWGLDHLGDNTTVFLHEGAKGARKMHRLINPATAADRKRLEEHPWGLELSNAAHLGWVGGALAYERTDWAPLMKAGVRRAYIVADNDNQGKAATRRVSEQLHGIDVFAIEFNDQFPGSFDLGDDFPKKFFKMEGDKSIYTGPVFRQLLAPATFATSSYDVFEEDGKKKKRIVEIRDEFRHQWVWVEKNDLFVHKEMPEIVRDEKTFNSMVSGFSHSTNTALLLKQAYQGRTATICYRPDIPERMVSDGVTSAINLYVPSQVKSVKGDATPWERYLEYMFPDEAERIEVKRWCATLIAKPEIRMSYGLLLISTRQGIGKNTLGEHILAPLVGAQNCSFPSEREIVESSFNGWIAQKRLIFVGEIYTGHSWKAYNTLKNVVTDKHICVNEKFMREYTIENWAHIIACSNSKKALRIEESDRRWYYPTVTENPWPKEKFIALYDWIASGGLGIVKNWAERFGDYVRAGAHAPMTEAKRALIQESLSEPVKLLDDWLQTNSENEKHIALAGRWIRKWLTDAHKVVHETDVELRRVMSKYGWEVYEERLQIDGVMQQVLMSPELVKFVTLNRDLKSKKELRDYVRSMLSNVLTTVGQGM